MSRRLLYGLSSKAATGQTNLRAILLCSIVNLRLLACAYAHSRSNPFLSRLFACLLAFVFAQTFTDSISP